MALSELDCRVIKQKQVPSPPHKKISMVIITTIAFIWRHNKQQWGTSVSNGMFEWEARFLRVVWPGSYEYTHAWVCCQCICLRFLPSSYCLSHSHLLDVLHNDICRHKFPFTFFQEEMKTGYLTSNTASM